jgi:hypothetical protein
MPLSGAQRLKEKLMSANVRNLVDKITEKDLQVIRTYNRSRIPYSYLGNDKNKKFLISKKSTSFTRHYDDLKNALVVSTQDPKTSPRADEEKRPVKTPL